MMRTIVCFYLALALLLGGAAAQSKRRVLGPFPAKSGEICVICYRTLDSTGLAYLIDGRRFAVDASESGEFLEDPDKHIQAFEADQATLRQANLKVPGMLFVLVAGASLVVWLRRRRRV